MPLGLSPIVLVLASWAQTPPEPVPEVWLDGLSGWGAERFAAAGESPAGASPLVAHWPTEFAPETWKAERPFERWGELTVAAGRPQVAPEIEAERCLLMLAQARYDEAWRALAALEDPTWKQALLPRFLPGLGPGTAEDVRALSLSPRGILRPSLPPPDSNDPRVLLEVRRAQVHGLWVGESRVDLVFELRLEGFEVRASLCSGPAVDFACVLPCPPGFERFAEYADWDRQETNGQPLPVHLEPGAEPWRLWGRFMQIRRRFPDTFEGPLPARVELYGLALVVDPSAPESACFEGLPAALTQLFGTQVRFESSQIAPPVGSGDPLRIRLLPGPQLETKLARILALAEGAYLGRLR